MNCTTSPALSFGIFDHLDCTGGSLRQQYSDRLAIAEACDEAGFRGYGRSLVNVSRVMSDRPFTFHGRKSEPIVWWVTTRSSQPI